MSHTEATFNIEHSGVIFAVEVVCYGGDAATFNENWEMSNEHQGGVTITVPNPDRNSHKYAIPKQQTLSELTAYYTEQKHANPSEEAFKSLQDQFTRDNEAGDYGFNLSCEVDGIGVLADFVGGLGFNWCYLDPIGLEEYAKVVLGESSVLDEALAEAKSNAGEIVANFDKLKTFATQE